MEPIGEPPLAAEKEHRLLERLRELGSALVAYSGGVDSAYLLWATHAALGSRALGVVGSSASLAPGELAAALAEAARLGVATRVLETGELEDARYLANPANRCYYCKSELYDRLGELADREGYAAVLDGTNADDLAEHRPGRAAAGERRVLSPLSEVGLGKAEIRSLARRAGLAAWDKPAQPCLSSRVPHGSAITPEKLRQIGAAEEWLRGRGFAVCRVRHHGEEARVEVPVGEVARLAAEPLRAELSRALAGLGFGRVVVDPRGYRSGGWSEPLVTAAGRHGTGEEGS